MNECTLLLQQYQRRACEKQAFHLLFSFSSPVSQGHDSRQGAANKLNDTAPLAAAPDRKIAHTGTFTAAGLMSILMLLYSTTIIYEYSNIISIAHTGA